MSGFRLTIRHGSGVEHEGFATLDEALDALEQHVARIRAEGPLGRTAGLRDYGPGAQVHARLELSTGGALRGSEAGLDVMGDGTLVPYVGVLRKRRLEPGDGETAFDAVREALA